MRTTSRRSPSCRSGETEVSLSQGPFKTEERQDLHRDGWTESFDKLEAVLRGD